MYTVRRVLISHSRQGHLDVVKHLIRRVNDVNVKNIMDGLFCTMPACEYHIYVHVHDAWWVI